MVSPEDINKLDRFVVAYLIGPILIQSIFYGIYVTLFCQCIYILRKRLRGDRRILLTGTVLLFVLCTAQLVLAYPAARISFLGYYNMAYVLANSVADILLTYRCYVIWGRKKYTPCAPAILILMGAVLGGIATNADLGPLGSPSTLGHTWDTRIALFLALTTNVLLTLLSAGRIWWTSREIRQTLGPKISKKYNTAISLIIESGVIYCVTLAAYLISIAHRDLGSLTSDLSKSDIVSRMLFGVLTQVVGIAPTLIVVRVGLGITTEHVQTTLAQSSGIHFRREEEDVAMRPGAMGSVGR